MRLALLRLPSPARLAGFAFGALCQGALFIAIPTAAGAGDRPGIVPIPHDTAMTQSGQYPPEMRVGNSDGRYKIETVIDSDKGDGDRIAFWGSEPGILRTDNYPVDEFVHVIEGVLVTTDTDGTRHEFKAGDSFLLPKGWAGTWDMRTRFKKVIVNY